MLNKFRYVVLAGLLATTVSQADLVIDVQGVAQPTPVAIVPFGWEGNAPAMPLDVSKVITHELEFEDFDSGFQALNAGEACKVILDLN